MIPICNCGELTGAITRRLLTVTITITVKVTEVTEEKDGCWFRIEVDY